MGMIGRELRVILSGRKIRRKKKGLMTYVEVSTHSFLGIVEEMVDEVLLPDVVTVFLGESSKADY